ncbi:cytochrome P450 family protein [Streptomyces zingiberis]|uniref:Cytochrome P450 n=1 Tax=Streptomyces zingiberis TaxID=2053010 RepID=A0ABX1C3T2_9ACTN|nr:cytochrome P450 [Streptomyces zingiberis]NJQ02800.1 cytochrome P450 [Streptomyces zingiberis]
MEKGYDTGTAEAVRNGGRTPGGDAPDGGAGGGIGNGGATDVGGGSNGGATTALATPAGTAAPVADLTALGADFTADPYSVYAGLRERGPVHRARSAEIGDFWLVVGYEAARAALTDPRLGKDWSLLSPERFTPTPISANMLQVDPPDHTRLRRLVSREFTARRVEALRPRVEEMTDGLLDAMAALPDGRADLVDALAFPLPMGVICELLGVPDLDRSAFRAWSSDLVSFSGPEKEAAAVEAVGRYLTELIARKRLNPGDDLLSALIRTTDEDGDRLSPEELVGMSFLLLIAGFETTVNLITNTVHALFRHPDVLAELRADFTLTERVVEEGLRWDGPVEGATLRIAAEPVEIGDVTIPAGGTVLVSLASADRDPARFPDADRFDPHRAPGGHVAFGHGIHFCLGAPLARMEAQIAIRRLLERFPELALDRDPGVSDADLPWIPGTLIRGLRELPVRLR